MRTSRRESEVRPSSADLLSKILRRGSHAASDAVDECADSLNDNQAANCNAGRSRKGSAATSNQHRHSVSASGGHATSNNKDGGNGTNAHRFTNFLIDPFYHAIALGKGKEDASPRSSISSAVENQRVSAPPSKEELGRRQALTLMSFDAMHLAFDPYNGCNPDDAMDDNELEILLEHKEEAKGLATTTACGAEKEKSVSLPGNKNQSEEPTDTTDESEQDEELDFNSPSVAMSVGKLMHRIESMSEMPSESVDATVTSNQDEEENSNDDNDSTSPDEEDEATVTALEDLDNLMLEAKIIPTYVPSCFPEAELPQQLSASVRRLVIDLKNDSEHRYELPPQNGFSARRRGNSCPIPARTQLFPPPSPGRNSRTPSASHESDLSHHKKKGTLGRLAPRFLETLHLRRKRKTFLYTDEELESIEGARWKIVELAFRFGGKHRFYLVQAVNMFFPLVKYGRRGGPHATRLHCNHCGTLQWQHKRGGLSEAVDLAHVLQILDGRQTAVFRKYSANAALDSCSFSIIFSDRTLDLETQNSSHRDWLVSALRTLISYARKQREAEQRAIAERGILPLEDQALSDQFRNGTFAGITSPPTSVMLV
ncbi:hypothetical protein FI667_g14566, partial [Globisporangium splendens]